MTAGSGSGAAGEWDGAAVRAWLSGRVAAARADQVTAQRRGRDGEDDCDVAAAEELVCSHVDNAAMTATQAGFIVALDALAHRDDYIWRGVYDDRRFDRHVRAAVRKVRRMAKGNTGFDRRSHYQ
ncbi:hypothetical protein [Sphingomonas sp. Mn802worker]|uniref:hypothetical protein n=1 Tax=Sphingomonas sp. Mn802worker TaxID=629773 RepID=UPI00037A1C06|nr:hypothetical protein [Sphingomonas sp. Mn802worker]